MVGKEILMDKIDSFSGPHRWLSNFWPSPVTLDGVSYPSVENAYQAAKTLNCELRKAFQDVPPGVAKRQGRMITLRPDWEQVKEQVMLDLLRQKFHVLDRRYLLLNTGTAELVEGNYWGDTYWGVCRGVGKNRLGMLLMQVRSELAREDL
jgi:ribA/ribD-fused uncharacterized protein